MAKKGNASSAYVVGGVSGTSEKEIYCENSTGTTWLVDHNYCLHAVRIIVGGNALNYAPVLSVDFGSYEGAKSRMCCITSHGENS